MLLCGQISMWSSTAPAAALTDSIYLMYRLTNDYAQLTALDFSKAFDTVSHSTFCARPLIFFL